MFLTLCSSLIRPYRAKIVYCLLFLSLVAIFRLYSRPLTCGVGRGYYSGLDAYFGIFLEAFVRERKRKREREKLVFLCWMLLRHRDLISRPYWQDGHKRKVRRRVYARKHFEHFRLFSIAFRSQTSGPRRQAPGPSP